MAAGGHDAGKRQVMALQQSVLPEREGGRCQSLRLPLPLHLQLPHGNSHGLSWADALVRNLLLTAVAEGVCECPCSLPGML